MEAEISGRYGNCAATRARQVGLDRAMRIAAAESPVASPASSASSPSPPHEKRPPSGSFLNTSDDEEGDLDVDFTPVIELS